MLYVSGAISYLSLLKKIVVAFELFGQYPSRTIKNLIVIHVIFFF